MKLVFLCVANSARSQMAEALARKLLGPTSIVASAGSRPSFVHPLALDALREAGIDHSASTSKGMDDIDWQGVDFVITLCTDEVCPLHVGPGKRLHWPFPDPAVPWLSAEEQREQFCRTRDLIEHRLRDWLGELGVQLPDGSRDVTAVQ